MIVLLLLFSNITGRNQNPEFKTSNPVFGFTAVARKLLIIDIFGFHQSVTWHRRESLQSPRVALVNYVISPNQKLLVLCGVLQGSALRPTIFGQLHDVWRCRVYVIREPGDSDISLSKLEARVR